jgi:hypothetical protein
MSNPKTSPKATPGTSKATPGASSNQLQTIDPTALAQVSGGTTVSTSTTNDQVLTALTGILSSIQGLAGQQNTGGGFSQQEMMLMMMVMAQRNQQQAAVASTSAWPWSQEPIVRYY